MGYRTSKRRVARRGKPGSMAYPYTVTGHLAYSSDGINWQVVAEVMCAAAAKLQAFADKHGPILGSNKPGPVAPL